MYRRMLLAFLFAAAGLVACRTPQEVCNLDGGDEDGDGASDCDDQDCAAAVVCQAEICDDQIDNNGNNALDCQEASCANDPACTETGAECSDGQDNDNDGDTDCDDANCANDPSCQGGVEDCDNGVDDDGDTDIDCDDSDCDADPDCQVGAEVCNNGVDDDGDAFADCADRDCDVFAVCDALEICDDQLDNDLDGRTDCQDGSCADDPACAGNVEICNNGVSDDADPFIDCADRDCDVDPTCDALEICNDTLDNDGDGVADCLDGSCADDPACATGAEICDDGISNDGDPFADCADRDCDTFATCIALEVCNDTLDNDGDGRVDCADGSCLNDPACNAGAVEIQAVQDGTIGENQIVTVNNVFVTAVRVAGNGNINAYVQEPQGQTPANHTYPEFAAVQIFATAAQAAGLPDMAGLAIGDCVSFTGTTDEFNLGTEVLNLTAFTKVANPASCGTAPVPFVIPSAAPAVTLADIATDSDPVTAGNQAGALAEAYEGVLIEIHTVQVAAAPDNFGEIPVADQANLGGARVNVDDFFTAIAAAMPVGQNFSAIRGVFNQLVTFKLQPRDANDLVP
jgi:hypothetical protein